MYAEFDDTLVTGNTLIDSQHKELIDKINALLKSCEQGSGKQAAVQTLGYLADYTEYHFREEEALQKEVGYPGTEEHKKEHECLRQTVQDLHDMLEEQEGPTEDFVNQVQKNVIDWLYIHIKSYDRSVAEYKNMTLNNERL
ncbi:MAG TPA: hemerythrin family protein [Candidatus Bariatricus faecipullorum]|nr:hemerythrin family protein [Candidatus Bariatricus faecipullorum]